MENYIKSFGVNGTPSTRTYEYERVCGATQQVLPDEFMLPNDRLPSVKNQETYMACCAFAASEVLNILYKIEFEEDVDFSEGYIYAKHRGPYSKGTGMIPSIMMDCLCKDGSVPKTYYDELDEMPSIQKKLFGNKNFSKLEEIATKYKIAGYVGFLNGNREDMKKALYNAQYPLFGVSNEYFGGGHAIIVVGWNKDGFVIQNSWGENYGSKGRNTIPLKAINYAYLFLDEVFTVNFKDVKETDWFYKSVKEVVFNGLMNGLSEDEFGPNEPLTRAQAAKLICNVMKRIDEILALKD